MRVLSDGVDWFGYRLRRNLNTKMQLGIQTAGFIHLFELPLSFHANERISGVMERFSNASYRISAIIRTLVNISPQLLSGVIGITLAASLQLLFAAIPRLAAASERGVS